MLTDWSLRKKLIAFSFAILVPLGLFAYYLVQENTAYIRRQILSDSAATAYVVAVSVDDFLRTAEMLLTALAQTPVMQEKDPAATQRLLRNVYLTQRRFTNLFVAGEDGSVFATVFWEEGRPPPASGTPYFHHVLQTGKPVIAATRISPITKEPEVMVAVPLDDAEGHRIGVLGGTLSLGELKLALTSIETQQPIAIIVVDSDGTAVIHPRRQYVLQRANLSDIPPIQAVLQGQRDMMEYRDPSDGEAWIAAYSPVSIVPWGVLVARPARLIYTDVQQAMIRNLLYFLLALLLAAALVLILTRRIVRPLHQLTDRIRDPALSPAGGADLAGVNDELQQIAEAFQLLSSHLEQSLNELTGTRNKIRRQTVQLQHLLAKFTRSKEEERRRLALDIHDGIAQFLVIALQETRSAEKQLLRDPESALEKLQAIQQLLAQLTAEMDRIVFDLRPPSLGEISLTTALQDQIATFEQFCGTPCTLEVRGDPRELPDTVELAAYRVVQEALHNVNKHAQASAVQILVEFHSRRLGITVVDDGKGFDQRRVRAASEKGLGLVGMRERSQSVGGKLEIESAIGSGTQVVFEVPVGQGAQIEPKE